MALRDKTVMLEDAAAELAAPVLIKAGSKPIDVEIGHAAPALADIDGSGKPKLLVGQFGEGKLRIYDNVGSRKTPRFSQDFEWLRAGRKVGKVPSG